MNRARFLASTTRELARRMAEEAHALSTRAWHACRGRARERNGRLPSSERLHAIRRQAQTALAEYVMPFWASHAWDALYGGFLTQLDGSGRWLGEGDKYLVPQARLVWTFAAAHRHGLVAKGYLELAGRGAGFLVDRMWDANAGGFFWAVRRDGAPLVSDKRTYGQAFAIYALSEYALAAESPWALDWAVRTLDVLNERAGDARLGFREMFSGGWEPLPGPAGSGKTVNVHLHVVEALTTLLEATADPRHAALLRAILDLVLSRGVHPRHYYAIEGRLQNDWSWDPSWRQPIGISYGHGVELAWLARRAVDVLGDPAERIRAHALGLVDHALDFGFDHRRGGVALRGPPLGRVRHAWYLPASWREKRWWEQAEMLIATLLAYQWTGAPRYLIAFERQFDWVWTCYFERERGDGPQAAAGPDTGLMSFASHDWKDPYHGVRALIEVSERLSTLLHVPSPAILVDESSCSPPAR